MRHLTGIASLDVAVASPLTSMPEPSIADGSAVEYTGYFGETSGLGIAAYRHARALREAGQRVRLRSVVRNQKNELVRSFFSAELFEAPPRRVGSSTTPREEILHLVPLDLARAKRRERTIGYVVWETEDLPPEWSADCSVMDELWVPSEFSAISFRKTGRKVRVLPHPIEPVGDGPRYVPDVPDDMFLFLAVLDWGDRKNPFGLLRAFRNAFQGRKDVGLLIKLSTRGARNPSLVVDLVRAATAFGPPVFVVTEALSAAGMERLYRRADAYVSLHRTEGFGLGMAQAMSAGTPVIATGWSGNLEFMDDASAFLVPFRLEKVRQRLTPMPFFYDWMEWARPDENAAAERMREVVDDGATRRRVADAGRKRVLEELAPRVVGARMRELLTS